MTYIYIFYSLNDNIHMPTLAKITSEPFTSGQRLFIEWIASVDKCSTNNKGQCSS